MKIKNLIILMMVLILGAGFMTACGGSSEATDTNDTADTAEEMSEETDAVTTASIVNTESAFKAAISADGTWIICTLDDLSFNEELVLDGQFEHREEPARKIALYTQDEDRNVTARFTLTAPKLTVNSESARIQGGTFVGDVYVNANNFLVTDATVEGNIYFSSQEYMDSFEIANGGKVTGDQMVK